MNSVNFEERLRELEELREVGDITKALIGFKKILNTWPREVQAWLAYGRLLYGIGQISAAEQAWQHVKKLQPCNSKLLVDLGHLYSSLRQPEKARTCFEEAKAADPTAIDPRISIALQEEKNHRFHEAREAVEQCFLIDSAGEQARYVSALLCHRENKLEQSEDQLRALIDSGPKHEYVRYAARYELAQILDRSGRFEEAMLHLNEAKNLVAALADAKILTKRQESAASSRLRKAKAYPKSILHTWSKMFPEKIRKQIPPFAFLGGHPRSGTTLLEQVLGSHPEVAAIDEPLVIGIAATASNAASWGFSSARLNVARQRYIEALHRSLGVDPDGRLLLEKNPSPTAMLPELLRVFPELRVIIAIRDPRDVVLSCYFQNIPLNQVIATWLSLEGLAKYYVHLMEVWLAVREWEGFSWIETKYEDIVTDLESEGRRVTQFLGLQWHENQRMFFEGAKKRRLYSPTYHDVTQPVYSRSVARWRNYEKYLEPILPVLEPYCRAFGYS